MSGDRHSIALEPEIVVDADDRARREATNGILQYNVALELIRQHVHDPERPFKLRISHILQLHKAALDGIHPLSGTFRNRSVEIHGSRHQPPDAWMVADETASLCEYVNENWHGHSAIHLASYILWKLNWIHPFADGNGRTSRAVSYLVLSIRMNSILPGVPTIPDQIASDKNPYYEALEAADIVWSGGKIDVSALEEMLARMLATQLLGATRIAGQPGTP